MLGMPKKRQSRHIEETISSTRGVPMSNFRARTNTNVPGERDTYGYGR